MAASLQLLPASSCDLLSVVLWGRYPDLRQLSAPVGDTELEGLESQGRKSLQDGALGRREPRSLQSTDQPMHVRIVPGPGKTHQEGQRKSCPELKEDVKSVGLF